MPLNFQALQPIQQKAQPIMGQAPQGSSDSGIGGFLQGLGQLTSAISGSGGQQPASVSSGNLGNTFSTQNPAAQIPNPNVNNQPLGTTINPQGNNNLYELARQHLGQNMNVDGSALNSFFQKSGVQIDPKTQPWCAGFANAVIQSGGGKGTGSLAARSFLNWGQPTNKPTQGDLVVLSRHNDPNLGHVGFFDGMNPDGSIRVLGGNQGNHAVNIESFSPDRVLGFRTPPTGQEIQNKIVPDAHPSLAKTMAGIASVESPGEKNPYTLVGPATHRGDQALGKYQIMSSNLPAWSKEAIGRVVSRQEFLNNPQLQEQIAGYQLNKSLKAGYSPQDTASIWFSGRPQNRAGHARDAFGTTVPQYIRKFNQGAGFNSSMNQEQLQSINPIQQAMNSRANPDPNSGAPLNLQKPIREMTPEEIQTLMRYNSPNLGQLIS